MIRKEELIELQKQEGSALLSLIAPMEKVFPASDKNPIIMKNLVREAERQLVERCDPECAKRLLEQLKSLTNEIDYTHTGGGIALFVSENFKKRLDLPTAPEKELVRVGKTFQTRDIVSSMNKNPRYLVLNLSAQSVRLYRGWSTNLEEVNITNKFPAIYTGPSRSEALTSITRQDTDSEELEDIRIFLRSVDENLYEIVNGEKTPLFLTGESEYVSFLMNHGKSKEKVRGHLNENLANLDGSGLTNKVYDQLILSFFDRERTRQLALLEESKGYNKAATGITDAWKCAIAGQVMTLLVEEHYTATAEINTDQSIRIIDPNATNEKMITHFSEDIVDDLMEKVIEMDGEVVIVPDGTLKENGQVAAILRYAV